MELTLGSVLGRALTAVDGLARVHIPAGIDLEHAQAIVKAANLAKPQTPAFAFLISGARIVKGDSLCPVVSANDSIRYREGNHIAVVFGRQPDLSSFTHTYREILGQSFPEKSNLWVTPENLAKIVMDSLIADTESNCTQAEILSMVKTIADCFTAIRFLHSSSQEGLRRWNSFWFDHVDRGLNNLCNLVKQLVSRRSSQTLSEVISRHGAACFGLPHRVPSGSTLPKSGAEARNFNGALQDYWSDSDRFAVSAQLLRAPTGAPDGKHPLSQIETSDLDAAVMRDDNHWLGLTKFVGSASYRLEAFSELSVEQFLDPDGSSKVNARLRVLSIDGHDLALSREPAGSPFLVSMESSITDGPDRGSQRLELRIPTRGTIAQDTLELSKAKVVLRPAKLLTWKTEEQVAADGYISLFGQLYSKNSAAFATSALVQVAFSLQVPVADALSPYLSAGVTATVLAYDRTETFLALVGLKGGEGFGKFVYLGRESDQDAGFEFTTDVARSPKGFLAVVSSPNAPASLDGINMDTHERVSDVFLERFNPSGDHEFVAGEFRFRVRPSASGGGQQSPVLAAAMKQQIVPDRPGTATESSLLGQAETFIAQSVVDGRPDFLSALGHVIMPSDLPDRIRNVSACDGGAILMSELARQALARESFASFDNHPFIYGPEAERLREAFKALRFNDLFLKKDTHGADVIEWPSRTSYRNLWDSELLAEYLDSYAALISAAKDLGDDDMLFWASYPMSIIVWDVTVPNGSASVLLSPLHPLRLAWLAGVEHTLYEAEAAVDLIGSVEGWNFPFIGPGDRRNRRLVAVPIDSGEDQLFLGWSMLVPAGTEEPRTVSAPARVGSSIAPGSAVSGLNSAAVDAALRAFRKMHPYISTLTVDLSAKVLQNRLSEIDQAVLSLSREWSQPKGWRLVGGVRVLDSVMRDGPAPRDEVTRLVRENSDMLLTWSRYLPQARRSQTCHVRFLQDSGSTVQVRGDGQTNGATGNVPLRRFAAGAGQLDKRYQSAMEPGVPIEMGWRPFSTALSSVESVEGPPIVLAGMLRRDLEDVSAEWTVLGETFLSPAVMGSLMDGNASGSKMLWEWRPPVLERRVQLPVLDRRPFVSIARVPDTFGTQLEDFLSKASAQTAASELKRTLMSTLGKRGVGLSSLLSMGGTHVAGAIGFFLAFSLFDQLEADEYVRLVMPIDASDYFLRTLAGTDEHGRSNQRADLLLIELNDEEVHLTPVEVKCYGLASATETSQALPGVGSGKLLRACEQLQVSRELLEAIREQSSTVSGADRDLWFNSLATLVETASRLSPGGTSAPSQLARRLGLIASGQVTVHVGAPLLTFFQRTGIENSAGEGPYHIGPVPSDSSSTIGLIASTESVFSSLKTANSALLSEWRHQLRTEFRLRKDGSRGPASAKPDGTVPAIWGTPAADAHLPAGDPEARSETTDVQKLIELEPSSLLGGSSEQVPSPFAANEQAYNYPIFEDGVRFKIGRVINSIGGAEADFWPSNTRLNQLNIGVVGDLGTGKTELVKALITQLRRKSLAVQPTVPTSMLVFDVKGDFQEPDFLEAVGGEVLEPHEIPLNVFLDVRPDDYSTKPHKQAAAFSDTLRKIYKGIGPVQDSNLKSVIRNLFDSSGGKPPTLNEILDAYVANASAADSVTAILEDFVHGEIFSRDRSELLPFSHLLEGRVLIVALDRLGQDQAAKNALVALFLNLYYDYMLGLEKMPFVGENPQLRFLKSFLVVDEAINIMKYDFEVLMNLMLQGRQFGVGIMLSSQYLSHFREGKVNYGQPLRTWFIHKVPQVSSRELEALGMPNLNPEAAKRIPALGQHEVLYKSYGWDEGLFVRVRPYYEL